MKKYRVTHMVRPEHLNHHENLYAGRAAEWMMEASFVAINLEYGIPDGILYKNTHSFEFNKSIYPGDIISYETMIVRLGRSSVTIHVSIVNDMTGETHAEGYTTFVTIDPATRRPTPSGLVLDETGDPDELAWREKANGFFAK